MVLKVLLCVFVLVFLPSRDNGFNETDWYQEAMTTVVVSHYNRAYKILNEDIIKPILEFDDKSSDGSNFDALFSDEQKIDEDDDDNKSKEDESSETKDSVEIVNGETTIIEDDWKIQSDDDKSKEDDSSETKDSVEIVNGETTLIEDDWKIQSDDDDQTKKDEYTSEGEEDESSETMVKRNVDDDDELDANEFKFVNDEELITTTEYISTVEVTESTPHADDAELNVSSTIQIHEEDVRLAGLVNKLRHGSNMVHELLKAASSGCEQLRTDLSTRIIVAAMNISTQEAELHRLQSEIQGLVSAVHSAEQQATFAEQVVREREATVENSERELREAENRVEKARRCQRRRRRRFIGGWIEKHIERPIAVNWQRHVERPVVRVVEEGIVKPVCSVVNMDGINRAKDARNMARDELSAARNRLSTQQQVLSNKRAQLSNVQIQQNAANERQRILRLSLTQMQTNFKTISSLLEQFQVVNTHLTTVLGSSKTLRDEIKNLVDFELVIEPLKSLAEKMINDQLMTSFNFEISARTIADVDRILDRLGDKLARFPVFIQDTTVSEDASD